MPWQLVSSQAGFRGAVGEKDKSGRKTRGGGSLGLKPPRVAGGAPTGEAEPNSALFAAGDWARSGSLIGPCRPAPLAISVPRPGEPYRSPLTPQPDPGPPA